MSIHDAPPASPDLIPNSHDPPYQRDQFHLGNLPDPPASWRVGGKTPAIAIRDCVLTKKMIEDMMEYHFWGIDPGIKGRHTKMANLKALYKLAYHQAPQHRPEDLGDMGVGKIDAGPRLLSCSIKDPSPMPVSRWYPNLPDGNTALQPGYIRPSDAAPDFPDLWLQQHLYSSKRRPGANAPPGRNDTPSSRGTTPASRGATPARRTGTAVQRAQARRKQIQSKKAPEPPSAPAPQPQPHEIAVPLSYTMKEVVESVERSVLRFAYTDLERHPTATPLEPCPHITANSEEDLLKAVVGSFPAVSQLQISFDQTADAWTFGIDGQLYAYRGRGPVWRNQSGAVDCAIVVGKLLDAGSTVIDRKESEWFKRFTDAERAFIEATDLSWDVYGAEISAGLRDHLWNVLARTGEGIGVGNFSPFWPIWSACTANFAQFKFNYLLSQGSCVCSGHGTALERCESSFVPATLSQGDVSGLTMQELVSRFFAPNDYGDCAVCNRSQTVPRSKRFDSLPMRMVVLCEDPDVKNHSMDLSFTYADGEGNERIAKYRWLGGVYYRNDHYRVIWTDVERGEANNGELRFYDSATNGGLIVGGIPPAHQHDRVPGSWTGDLSIPMVVYERVLDPEQAVLGLAQRTIQEMKGMQMQGQFILDGHSPWSRAPSPKGMITQPWTRILPNYGQRFHTSPMAHFPGAPANRASLSPSRYTRQAHPSPQLTHSYLSPALPRMPSPFGQNTFSNFINSPNLGSRAGSVMHIDSDPRSGTATPTNRHGGANPSPSSSTSWAKVSCAAVSERRPSKVDTPPVKKTKDGVKRVRFQSHTSSSTTESDGMGERKTRRSPRLNRAAN